MVRNKNEWRRRMAEKDSLFARFGFWKSRKHYLNKMTLRELIVAYFQYYAIQAYLAIGTVSLVVLAMNFPGVVPTLIVVGLSSLAYPLAWYLLHRYILHGQFLYRMPLTAPVWKRIHYDHHQDPYDLEVLFGALYTTLPTVAIVTMPMGWLIGGIGGAFAGLATGVFVTCFYEFCHCIQHLAYKPKSEFLKRIKKWHMSHHFHNENGNFGITNYVWDRAFGTFDPENTVLAKSPTVFNLGYTEEEAVKYPWVARVSGGLGPATPRERRISD
ncbi:MAG: sterol desaturase family protein [Sphingomonadales bacterium]|nr:sterol desaturase family protein [Sphingomonadales bacterium]